MLSNATTELTLELDEIQTWFFDMTIQPGLVLREHSVNDDVFENLMPEPFNITDYTYRDSGGVLGIPDGVGMVGSNGMAVSPLRVWLTVFLQIVMWVTG